MVVVAAAAAVVVVVALVVVAMVAMAVVVTVAVAVTVVVAVAAAPRVAGVVAGARWPGWRAGQPERAKAAGDGQHVNKLWNAFLFFFFSISSKEG